MSEATGSGSGLSARVTAASRADSSAGFSIAPFRCDITPPLGHSLLGGWIEPVKAIDDNLEAIGYVLLGADAPIVVCVLDWAGLLNEAHQRWRTTLALAAGTSPDRVAVHCVHQHNTPFVCPEARAAAARHADLPEMYDLEFFERCLDRAAQALQKALSHAQPVTHVAHGEARVEGVASNRRVDRGPDGRIQEMRLSSCTDPRLIALPEGTIDPMLQTIAYYAPDGRKIVACHYYATHPMSFYRDGRVTSDFCGLARKRRQEADPDCTHLYFTGCAGNISAGKYNDGSPAARVTLTERIHAGMMAAEATLVPEPLTHVGWRKEHVLPPPLPHPTVAELEVTIADSRLSLAERLVPAFRLGWLRRFEQGTPFVLSCLQLNTSSIVHLPGEMFIEYQLRARARQADGRVAVAAYGDDGLWYVPTKVEYPRGGYEVSAAFCRDDVDAIMTTAIERLLEVESAPTRR